MFCHRLSVIHLPPSLRIPELSASREYVLCAKARVLRGNSVGKKRTPFEIAKSAFRVVLRKFVGMDEIVSLHESADFTDSCSETV